MGMVEGNTPVSDNDWEKVTKKGDAAIKKWIADQMHGRSCTVVLVGSNTAGRKWIEHEIVKSWDDRMGVVGIHMHGLKNLGGKTATKGSNPFAEIPHGKSEEKLSTIVKCYTPSGSDSKERYAWIKVAFRLSLVLKNTNDKTSLGMIHATRSVGIAGPSNLDRGCMFHAYQRRT